MDHTERVAVCNNLLLDRSYPKEEKIWAHLVHDAQPQIDNFISTGIIALRLDDKTFYERTLVASGQYFLRHNWGRVVEFEKICYATTISLCWSFACKYNEEIDKTFYAPAIIKESQHPYDKFKPSIELMHLIQKRMLKPEPELEANLRSLNSIRGSFDKEQPDFLFFISECVESLFANLAKRASITGSIALITKNNRFTPEVCTELIERLELDPFDPRSILEKLYNEISSFLSVTYREREWGKIISDVEGIKLIAKDNAFPVFNFQNIDEDFWEVS